jgi:hypothetical protein
MMRVGLEPTPLSRPEASEILTNQHALIWRLNRSAISPCAIVEHQPIKSVYTS